MRFDNKVQLTESLSVQDTFRDFLQHHQASGHSPCTITHYKTSLRHFEEFLSRERIDDLSLVRAQHLRAFFADLIARFKPKTANGIASDIRALFSFLAREEAITSNPVQHVTLPKLDKLVLPAFDAKEVKSLLNTCKDKTPVSIRNRAIMLTMLDTGARVSEITSMQVGQVDLETGAFKVLGKGRKERICRLSPTSIRALASYCKLRKGKSGEPLWCGKHGPLTRNGIGQIIGELGKEAGVHAHPHKFRRTCALTILRQGCDIFSLSALMGHSDLTVLRRYLAQSQSDYKTAHERFSAVTSLVNPPRAN